MTSSESDRDMLPSTWSEEQIVVRAVEVPQTPALHDAVTECVDIVALDPTFAEVPVSEVGELVEQSVAGGGAGTRLPHEEHSRRTG